MRAVKETSRITSPSVRRGEKEAISLRRRRLFKSVMKMITVTGICVVVISSIYIWRSGALETWIGSAEGKVKETLVEAGLVVEVVRIGGTRFVDEDTINALADIKLGDPLLSQDINAITERIEDHKWINKAAVRRELSGEILINVLEHQPVALWQVENKLWVVSDEGIQIDDENLEYFAALPMISGVGAQNKLENLITAISSNLMLFERVETASWVGGRRWDLILKNGIKVMLPERDLALAWQNLTTFVEEEQLLARNILAIDFRVKDKTVVRLTPEEAERRRLLAKTSGKGEEI